MIPFKVSQRYTIIRHEVTTSRREITVRSVLPNPEPQSGYVNGPVLSHRYGTFVRRGQRKEYYLDIFFGDLVFEGWDLPIETDTEIPNYGGFHGNACFNIRFKGTPDPHPLREFIETYNLNPDFSDRYRACIIIPGDHVSQEGTLAYPELDTSHAVIERMKNRMA